MRFRARYALALVGLALAAAPPLNAQAPALVDTKVLRASESEPAHRHKGPFGWRHCVDCQRAWAKKRHGVDVPPPPSALPPGVVPAPASGHVHQGHCAACQEGATIVGPVMIVDSQAPGYAEVGGTVAGGSGFPPGHAWVGGSDPTPVGVARSGQPASLPMAGTSAAAAGPYDPSVLPSSMIPPQTALDMTSTRNPHVLRHMLGFGPRSGGGFRAARERKAREQHAAIAYDPPGQTVSELPASMVYGKGH